MVISIDVTLPTDGDFALLERDKIIQDEADIYINDGDWCNIVKSFYSKDDAGCKSAARYFVDRILCDIHVLPNHRYLLPLIYRMFDSAAQFICTASRSSNFYDSIGGNYEETYISIRVYQ